MAIFIPEAVAASLIDFPTAVDVLIDAYRSQGQGTATNRSRIRIPIKGGTYNLMAAANLQKNVVGLKVYTASKNGAPMLIVLHSADGAGLLAVIEGGKISGCRTGAISGLSTRFMARSGRHVLGVIGTGFQARAQILGVLAAVSSIERIVVFSRNVEKVRGFVASMATEIKIPISAASSSEQICTEASVIVLITNSSEPVIETDKIRPGTHVIAAGNNTWLRNEFEPALAAKVSVVVDDLDQARLEAGELMRASELGLFNWDRAIALSDVVCGLRTARSSDRDVTLFCSQGVGLSDVAVATHVYHQARENSLGVDLDGR
jgi:ornithine cyclodeaminase/alanine dehydrogenase-like protein (mu-crystallin family)